MIEKSKYFINWKPWNLELGFSNGNLPKNTEIQNIHLLCNNKLFFCSYTSYNMKILIQCFLKLEYVIFKYLSFEVSFVEMRDWIKLQTMHMSNIVNNWINFERTL